MLLAYVHSHYCAPPALERFEGPLTWQELEFLRGEVERDWSRGPGVRDDDLDEIDDVLPLAKRGKPIYMARDHRGLYFAVRTAG